VAIWVGALACAIAVGAAAMGRYGSQHTASHTQCVSLPVSPDAAQAELARAQLALAQESTARVAVQKAADASAAEVSRLNTELLFLRGQRQKSR
jgi:hypothetical protein